MAKKRKSQVPGMKSLGSTGGAFGFFGPSPERDYAIEQGWREAEFGALMFVASVDDSTNPPCPGPVVVHADGAIECEGGCAGVRFAYHGAGSTVACDVAGGSTSHSCTRCAAA